MVWTSGGDGSIPGWLEEGASLRRNSLAEALGDEFERDRGQLLFLDAAEMGRSTVPSRAGEPGRMGRRTMDRVMG